ncbi:DUF1800 domain-containing protein [Gemmobacter serpentinus]|uniref:DUF1800 domain-containing protein n=1 Tax=Gemmobacter serpentinus TaxID=2652247 RepID=UPI00124E014F|nr:DUF1800 domain-containing protein [Gemmobacter serpentinus]
MPDPSDILAFRFGYGLPLPAGSPAEPDAILARLIGPDQGMALWPGPTEAEVQALLLRCTEARRAARKSGRRSDERKIFTSVLREVLVQDELFMRLALARGLDSPDGFRERLVRFWADHFTTIARTRDHKAVMSGRADHVIRPRLTGRFADLLIAMETHPAMLLALDQSSSIGPNSPVGSKRNLGLNENLAREMIELHTLGVGAGYSQEDVRQLAELLTGLSVEPGIGTAFNPRWVEPGPETVLGRSYDGEGLAPIRHVMEDLAHRPETALHLARKLVVHFVSDQPDADLVARMAKTYLANDTAMMPMLQVLLADPAVQQGPLQKARQPFDFMVSSLRALGVTGAEVLRMARKPFLRMIRDPLMVMGQDWENPRGPDGWPESAESWITPQGLAARIGWAMETPGRLVKAGAMPDPQVMLAQSLGSLADEGAGEMPLSRLVARSESQREAVGLILAAPQFNRR